MHLTAHSALAATAIAVLALLAIWSDGLLWAWSWRIAAAGLALGLLFEAAWLMRRPLRVALIGPPVLRLGRITECVWRIEVPRGGITQVDWAPQTPSGVAAWPATLRARVAAGAVAVDASQRIQARDLGALRWPAGVARLLGPLGLAWWARRMSLAIERAVGADLRGLARPNRGAPRVQPAAFRTGQAGAPVDLHPARPEDPVARIDWKIAARTGLYLTRRQADDALPDLMLLLDQGSSAHATAQLNLVSRIAHERAARSQCIGVCTFADRVMQLSLPQPGWAGLQALDTALRRSEPQPGASDLGSVAAALQGRLARGTQLVLFGTSLSAHSLPGLQQAAARLTLRNALWICSANSPPPADRDEDDPDLAAWLALAVAERADREAAIAAALRARGVSLVRGSAAALPAALARQLDQPRRTRSGWQSRSP